MRVDLWLELDLSRRTNSALISRLAPEKNAAALLELMSMRVGSQ